eukprot:517550-Karenia_brevis.AAC.1
MFGGVGLSVKLEPGSKDQSKIVATGVHSTLSWRNLKYVFGEAGRVQFVETSKRHITEETVAKSFTSIGTARRLAGSTRIASVSSSWVPSLATNNFG